MARPSLLGLTAAAVLVLAAVPLSLQGQAVEGVVVDAETQAPVEGAVVRLLDEESSPVLQRLTGGAGTFQLPAPRPGSYRVEVERIGYLPHQGEPHTLERGEVVEERVAIRMNPISLEGISVEGEGRCVVRPEEGALAARLWDEARLALTATELTSEEEFLRFRLTRWRRDLDPSARRVETDEREVREGMSTNPLRSAPAEELRDEGYIRPTPDGGHIYFVPDAEALLSDAFLDSHCFFVEEGEGDDGEPLLGLRFEPTRDRNLPDVQGVLWLDPATSQLRHMELDYTDYPYDIPTRQLGARVDFQRLPNGSWVVRQWWVRMPRVGLHRSQFAGRELESYELLGIVEEGAEAVLPEGAGELKEPRGVISGVVVDSTWITRDPSGRAQPRPLADARVELAGTAFHTDTDPEGAFRMERVPEGGYHLLFHHPRLDSLGLEPLGVDARVAPDGSLTVDGEAGEAALAIPSTFSLLQRFCPDREPETGAVTGRVVRPDGTPAEGMEVEVSWSRFWYPPFPGAQPVIQETLDGVRVSVEEGGRYRVCNLPGDAPTVQLRAWDPESEEGGPEVRLNLLPSELAEEVLILPHPNP